MANIACDPVTYWIGTTTERFTINTDINETSNITNDPNNGSNSGGTLLDFPWIMTNFNTVNRFVYRGEANHKMNMLEGDVHGLIVIPSNLAVSGLVERILGTLADLTQGIHYDEFTIMNGADAYTCYYLRDLTNISFSRRQFQFDIKLT